MVSIALYIPNSNKNPAFSKRKVSDYPLYMVQTDGKNAFGAPFAPKEVTYTNWGRSWTEVARDGRLPYLVNDATKLPKMSFTLVVANPRANDWNATPALMVLKRFSETNVPIQIRYGGWFESNFRWRCTNFSFKSVQRRPQDNAITWAEVEMEFTIVQDVTLTSGPISGQTTTLPSKPTGSKVGKRKYKLKESHTLNFLADHFYGSTKYWRFLADLNKIKNPKTSTKLSAGKTIIY